ncbi:hypothetical protein EVAR_24200_1 [Eumeta japonica]|uniref:Uncharacterized protein n=1 Tax=Eumeta variegata TaxID=151549 RepID=A0A4C1W7D3_EUMVA|nr:hypothetical protein EVAR_24200_1 [Eumeta japonica]
MRLSPATPKREISDHRVGPRLKANPRTSACLEFPHVGRNRKKTVRDFPEIRRRRTVTNDAFTRDTTPATPVGRRPPPLLEVCAPRRECALENYKRELHRLRMSSRIANCLAFSISNICQDIWNIGARTRHGNAWVSMTAMRTRRRRHARALGPPATCARARSAGDMRAPAGDMRARSVRRRAGAAAVISRVAVVASPTYTPIDDDDFCPLTA